MFAFDLVDTADSFKAFGLEVENMKTRQKTRPGSRPKLPLHTPSHGRRETCKAPYLLLYKGITGPEAL